LQRTYLPIVPAGALRRFRVHEPFDHRFRACARLLQSLWRTDRGLPIGSYSRPNGETYRLGSLITEKAGETGANFLTPEIARVARREVAYREPGALIEERRLWCNLLSSMTLTFNLFAPLKLNAKLATKVLRALFPDLADATVEEVLFEHSPGRGDPELTGDYTAFDVVLAYAGPGGVSGFIAVEVKYAESVAEPQNDLNARHAELAAAAGLHKTPVADMLTGGSLQQFFRQHLLAQAMLARGFASGTFMVLAPALNTPVQNAVRRYADQLNEAAAGKVVFESRTVEEFVGALRQCGERAHADALHHRYLAWERVDDVIEQAIADFGRVALVGNDNAAGLAEAA
jgi:hypothetical protein